MLMGAPGVEAPGVEAPGVFVAGEMIDWEAPTGGYLLTACFGSGRAAGRAALDWLVSPCRRT
jgi:predicted flavoprotein YhiN